MLQEEASCQSVQSQENTPSLPRRQESTPSIRHSREGRESTPSIRHSREGRESTPNNPSRSRDQAPQSTPSIRHSRLRQSSTPSIREFIAVPLPQHPKKHSVIPAKTYCVIPAKAGIHPINPSFPRRRESIIPAHAGIQRKHHPDRPDTSFPHGTTSASFPRMREFIVPLPQHPKKHSVIPAKTYCVIPAKAGIHPITRHSREGRNPPHQSVIPAKAGIHNSRARGNSTKTPSRPTDTSFPHRTTSASFPRMREFIHTVITGTTSASFPRMREFIVPLPQHPKKHSVIPAKTYCVIPAKAGIHPITRHSREGRNPPHQSVIPAKAGIHNSRARGNSTKTPSRPTRHLIPTQDYLSVIPAYAGIHHPITPTPEKTLRHSREDLLRHSREGGNPPHQSVIPAKAGIHNSRARGNSTKTPSRPDTSFPHGTTSASFPRMREFIVPLPQCPKKHSVIPATDQTASFPRRRDSTPSIRHSRVGGNP